jgi:hypothetical protein
MRPRIAQKVAVRRRCETLERTNTRKESRMKKILLATAVLAVMATPLILATPKAKASTGCDYLVISQYEYPNPNKGHGSFCIVWTMQKMCEGFPVDNEFLIGGCFDADGNPIDD